MAKKESTQKQLQRVRPPRIQLTYDVELGDAVEKKELPFVVGVVGDFAGSPPPNTEDDSAVDPATRKARKPLPRLKDRKFVNVDRDNFDGVMEGLAPRAVYRAKNTLTPAGGTFGVDLTFNKIDDFRPEAVAENVKPIKELLEARAKLADLRNKLAGNDKLEDILGEVLTSTEKLERLGRESNPGDKN